MTHANTPEPHLCSSFLASLLAALPLLAPLVACGSPSPPQSAADPQAASAPKAARASSWRAPASESLAALDQGRYVVFSASEASGAFPLVVGGQAAPWVVSPGDFPGVRRVVSDLQRDVQRVTGVEPRRLETDEPARLDAPAGPLVVVGALGHSPLVDGLVRAGKLDASPLSGRWETHLITVVQEPWPNVPQALVIAGSDQRGAIFGAYDLSRQMGVSPWHYWDDVPAKKHAEVFVKRGRYSQGEPAVKYRGFFINDEEPQLGRWARATFGPAPNEKYSYTFNHQLYAHVYEVLLRLKGNYLWPAVWGRSLFDDDPQSQPLAAQYGIVMGTSHEAPMMRAQHEWNRYGSPDGPYGGNGAFSFVRNQPTLEKYWADGLRRMNGFESLVTVGMRGNGDTGMEDAQGTELMGRIVSTQRDIIEQVLGKPASEVPQVWTLYKEVQDYWDAGMRAPDDVTIIWCDDNWGNLRGLPDPRETLRSGGYGLYYHYDYVGGGRNYKWVDTTEQENQWEQLHLAYRYGVDRVWMTNVGDLKNNEHPLQFFLDYAWDPERWPVEKLSEWEVQWAAEQFGSPHAKAIAQIVEQYGNLQSRRKPELLNRVITLDPDFDLTRGDDPSQAVRYEDGSPYSLNHYGEAERVVEEWRALAKASESIRGQLAPELDDAYFQLVHYAIAASANVYELRLAQFQNLAYARQGRAATAERAEKARQLFARDQALSRYYNEELAGGKWKHWQTQPKLGYGGPYPDSSWQQPQQNGDAMEDFIWPELRDIQLPEAADLAVALDGSAELWPGSDGPARLPEFSPYQTYPTQFIEVVNRGRTPFDYRIEAPAWMRVTPSQGRVETQVRASVVVDFEKAPRGRSEQQLVVVGPRDRRVAVTAIVFNPEPAAPGPLGFVEADGFIAFEAEHFERHVERNGVGFRLIPHIGRTAGGLTPFPVTSPRQDPGGDSPRLEYDLHTFSAGEVEVWAYFSPRNDVMRSNGLEYAISVDDEPPQIVNITTALGAIPMNRSWERNTSDNVTRVSTRHRLEQPGAHVLKFWMVDPTVIVQKLVVDLGGLRDSYLGPPESFRASRPPTRGLPRAGGAALKTGDPASSRATTTAASVTAASATWP